MTRNRLGLPARFLMVATAVACWIPCVPAAAAGMPLVQAPSAPRQLQAIPLDANTIHLQWVTPENHGGDPITEYRIKIFVGGFWIQLGKTTGTDLDYEHSHGGTLLRYHVTAFNGLEGPPSNEVTGTGTPGTPGAPGAPLNLTAVAVGTAINLSWGVPLPPAGKTISGYRVNVSTNGGVNFRELTTIGGTQYQHSGLTTGTYHYEVKALYSDNTLGPPAYANATTAVTGFLGAPRNLDATAAGPSVIELDWDAPSSNGGSAITEYQIHESSDGGNTWGFLRSTDAHVTAFTHTGLTAGTTHHYRVRARNTIGDGPWTSVVHATTADNATPGPPRDLTANADGASVIELDWRAPSDAGSAPVTGYRIEWSATGVVWDVLEPNNRDTDYRDEGLSPGTTRHYRVAAINRHGQGDWSNEASATTSRPPGRPTGLVARARGTSSIELGWTAPSGGGPVTGYRIEWSATGIGTRGWTLLVGNHRATSYTDTRLSPGTTRHYRVAAINTAGESPWSSIVQATTEVTVPGAPTSLRVSQRTSTQIQLTWRAPASNGGSPITGYRIEIPPPPPAASTGSRSYPAPPARPPPTWSPVLPPTRPGSIGCARATPRGLGPPRTRSEAPPTPHGPASPGTCVRAGRDPPASPSPGRRRPATAGSRSPATPSSGAAPTTETGKRSLATRVRRRPPSRTRASSRQPHTGTRWRRSTAWDPASGRSRRARARTPRLPGRRSG